MVVPIKRVSPSDRHAMTGAGPSPYAMTTTDHPPPPPPHRQQRRPRKQKTLGCVSQKCLARTAFVGILFYACVLILTAHLFLPSWNEPHPHFLLSSGGHGAAPPAEERVFVFGDAILTAYLEPVYQEDWEVKPLPIRNTTARGLTKVEYPRVTSCHNLTQTFPIDDYPGQYLEDGGDNDYVGGDSYLPWIHDVFPTDDGAFVQFVAQNKRRCNTGPDHMTSKRRLLSQCALFQTVPVKRINSSSTHDDNANNRRPQDTETRYQLTSYQDADPDGKETRFICRFKPSMEETLSVHNIDYDYATWRKGYASSCSVDADDIQLFWMTQLLFRCPVPTHLQALFQSGHHSTPTQQHFVDIIPIRTPPRHRVFDYYNPPRDDPSQNPNPFIPLEQYGPHHILPRIEDSGRWENIPICQTTRVDYANTGAFPKEDTTTNTNNNNAVAITADKKDEIPPVDIIPKKKHRLAACFWASALYKTRGDRATFEEGLRRMREWLEFAFLTGFDHVYIYDNSGAFDTSPDAVSLKQVADLFPSQVTHVPWPCKICNNHPNNVPNKGHRSSQYAAEASCLQRFGGYTDWMANVDYDEYLVPLGEYNGLKPILDKLDQQGKKIFNFKSYRAWPRRTLIAAPNMDQNKTKTRKKPCFDLEVPQNTTYLQTYNCERQNGPKKTTVPAEKQIYRPDYVKLHFIHYSTVTTESAKYIDGRKGRYRERHERYSDEVNEAMMVHAKTVARPDTVDWEKSCKTQGLTCRIGTPFPNNMTSFGIDEGLKDADGWLYNCYITNKTETYWVPKLSQALKQRRNNYQVQTK